VADSSPPGRPHDFAEWDRLIRKELDGTLAGGYAYEILQNGRVVASDQRGFARAPREKVSPSVPMTLFKPAPMASVSKTITAVAMLRLWEEKKGGFSLDDPFWPYVKRLAPHPDPEVTKITIRQLLKHQSGFGKTADLTSHEDLSALLKRPLVRRPGRKFEYLDNNYYIARVVLEQIARESYPRYVRNHVLRPMGITQMKTCCEPHAPMCGYGEADDQSKPGYPFAWDCTRWAGGAGWYGSVDDMARFMHGLRDGNVLSGQAKQILFTDALGFDWEEPGFGKGGDWVFDDNVQEGEVHTAVCYFPDGIEAAMVINAAYAQGPLELLEDTWKQSLVRTGKRASGKRLHPANS